MTKKRTKDIVVQNRSGLHARPSTMIVQESQKYKSDIKLHRGSTVADCRSVLDLLSLAACNGSEVRLEVIGEDADEAMQSVAALFECRFKEEDESC
ncbi:phosphocarrier protein HPr [Planctomycetales bacterium]|nr:phosphocarrier protein HPr [Planctomycetales bacterium]